jgi:hypothetical protein
MSDWSPYGDGPEPEADWGCLPFVIFLALFWGIVALVIHGCFGH